MSIDLSTVKFVSANPKNYSKNRSSKISYIVLHAMVGSYTGSIAWFQNPKAVVSAHYCVSQAGEITQMVRDTDTAYHCYGVNFKSIGIEMEDKGQCMKNGAWITPAMFDKTAALCAALCKKHGLDESKVIRHCESWIQAIGKAKGFAHSDPGPHFDITKFRLLVKEKLGDATR